MLFSVLMTSPSLPSSLPPPSPPSPPDSHTHIWRGRRWPILADHGEDGQEEGSCLPRPGLGTGHEVSLGHDDGQSILLDWSGPGVLGELWGRGGGGGGEEEEEGGMGKQSRETAGQVKVNG